MEVILLEKVHKLGDLGDQVSVKPGYGRNYLIPNGKAAPATAANKATFDARRAELERVAAEALAAARARAQDMDGAAVQIVAKVGDEGKLFGSVTTADIAAAMAAAGHTLAKAEIHLPEGPLKTVGEHEVSVSVHPEVHFKIKVSIVPEA